MENKRLIDNIFDNVFVINLDRSPDRLRNIKTQLDEQDIKFKRVSAIDGKKLTKNDIEKNCTFFAKMFCPKNIIACAMSHKKVWREIIKSGRNYGMIFEDDCKITDNFKEKVRKCVEELNVFDKKWDFLYLGYFGPSRVTSNSVMNCLQNIILNKIPKKHNNSNLKHIFVPVSPVGFHSYIISRDCAKKLLKYMKKIHYHIDSEFLKYACNFNVYATIEKLGNQYSTVDNSTLNEYKFPKIINWYNDQIVDIDGISYSYWLGSPIIQIQSFPINLYFIFFLIMLFGFQRYQFINILALIYMFLELGLDVNNINIIIVYMLIVTLKL